MIWQEVWKWKGPERARLFLWKSFHKALPTNLRLSKWSNRSPNCDWCYTDIETILSNLEHQLASTFFGGEAFPCHWVYHGPVPMSAYFGGTPQFREDTVWYDPEFGSWDKAETWSFDPDNQWWQMNLEITRASLEHSQGRYLISGCGLGGISDVIANLWGVEETLMAMAEKPEVFAFLRDRMVTCFQEMYDEVYGITASQQPGSFNWLQVWAPGRMTTLQSDISCMISPLMFEDLILQEIQDETEHVDYALYHLDGPDAIKHLDALLSVDTLNGIQWVSGAGASQNPLDWLDLLQRIQKAGKIIDVSCPPDLVKPLLNQIDRRLVILTIRCKDEEHVSSCLAELDRIGI